MRRTAELSAAEPQPKAGRTNRGTRGIRGKLTSSRFAFRVFRVFRGSLVFAALLWSHYPKVELERIVAEKGRYARGI